MSGTLVVTCKHARLFRDTEFIGKMDPYVIVELGAIKKKTKTHNSGGKKPQWDETFKFQRKAETEITFTVMDEDVTSDDHVGSGTLFLDDIFKKGKFKDFIKLQYKGKEAGQLFVEIEWLGAGGGGTVGQVVYMQNPLMNQMAMGLQQQY